MTPVTWCQFLSGIGGDANKSFPKVWMARQNTFALVAGAVAVNARFTLCRHPFLMCVLIHVSLLMRNTNIKRNEGENSFWECDLAFNTRSCSDVLDKLNLKKIFSWA